MVEVKNTTNDELSLEQMLTDYGDTLGEISPGLVDQMDELIVKTRDFDVFLVALKSNRWNISYQVERTIGWI